MKQINDRFAFDSLLRKLLKAGFSKMEALNHILSKYSLSALVAQERIENRYYQKIRPNEEISADLLEFENQIFREKFLDKLDKLLN